MSTAVTNTIVGAVSGALLGSISGWLIDKGKGAAIGAIAGGAALAFVGYAQSVPSASPAAGTSGLPRGAGGLSQLQPQRRMR